jgi:hypothetical protein
MRIIPGRGRKPQDVIDRVSSADKKTDAELERVIRDHRAKMESEGGVYSSAGIGYRAIDVIDSLANSSDPLFNYIRERGIPFLRAFRRGDGDKVHGTPRRSLAKALGRLEEIRMEAFGLVDVKFALRSLERLDRSIGNIRYNFANTLQNRLNEPESIERIPASVRFEASKMMVWHTMGYPVETILNRRIVERISEYVGATNAQATKKRLPAFRQSVRVSRYPDPDILFFADVRLQDLAQPAEAQEERRRETISKIQKKIKEMLGRGISS